MKALKYVSITFSLAYFLGLAMYNLCWVGLPQSLDDYKATLPKSYSSAGNFPPVTIHADSLGGDGHPEYYTLSHDGHRFALTLGNHERIKIIMHSGHNDRYRTYVLIPSVLEFTVPDSVGDYSVAYFPDGSICVSKHHWCGGFHVVLEEPFIKDKETFMNIFTTGEQEPQAG